jgi:hypothetical protein
MKKSVDITDIKYFKNIHGKHLLLNGMFLHQSVFVTCTGPSLTTEVINKLKTPGIYLMGLNNSPSIIRPHFWTCVDKPPNFLKSIWYDATIMKFIYYKHLKMPLWDSITDTKIQGSSPKGCPNIITYDRNKSINEKDWVEEPTFNWGMNPGNTYNRMLESAECKASLSIMPVMLKILVVLGFKNIYLTGCDFNMQSDKPYAFDENKTEKDCQLNNEKYDFLNIYFENITPALEKHSVKIHNCTPNSGLTAFPYKDLDEAINNSISKHLTCIGNEPTLGMYNSNKLK